MYTVYFS